MAENMPEAPAETTQVPASEATNTNPEPQAPEQKPVDLGLTSEQAERFSKFIEANGGFDSAFKKLKTDVSTPDPKPETPAQTQPEASQAPQTPEQPQEPTSPQQPTPPPAGAVTQQEMMDQYYFEQKSKQEKYASIAKEIAGGSLLKEMGALGIEIHNPDGSYNDAKINAYLDIKAQTVPAKQTSAEPDASPAPTVDYANVGDKITSMDQARKVLSQSGHPMFQQAADFLRNELNPQKESGQKDQPVVQ